MIPVAIVVAGVIIALGIVYRPSSSTGTASEKATVPGLRESSTVADNKVFPRAGVVLPVTLGNLGRQLVAAGAIDGQKFRKLYESENEYTREYEQLLNGDNPGNLKITRENASI